MRNVEREVVNHYFPHVKDKFLRISDLTKKTIVGDLFVQSWIVLNYYQKGQS